METYTLESGLPVGSDLVLEPKDVHPVTLEPLDLD